MNHYPRCAATVAAVALLLGAPAARADDPIDSVMDRSPAPVFPKVVKQFPNRFGETLIEALARPEIETKCLAAQTIARAHRDGAPGLSATVSALVREFNAPQQHSAVRLAAALAIIELDARASADDLFRRLSADDAEYRELVEPVLGKWNYQPVRALWLERLAQAQPHRRQHLIAIRGLGALQEEKAVPALRALVRDRRAPVSARVEAARALANVRKTGLEQDARDLIAGVAAEMATERLLAALLLRHHQGDEAVRLLQAFGRDAESTVAAVALARLVELDTKLVVPFIEQVLSSADANVRTFGVEVLFRQPSAAHIRLLGARLPDPHPDVRSKARVTLFELGKKPEFREPVLEQGTKALAGRDWREQEQAAVLLAQLDHKPATKRLLELLTTERPEAFIAAAWALRQLAVPDTLPPVLDFVRAQHRKILASGPTAGRTGATALAVDRQLSQLIQFLGQARHAPANGALREMLPRVVPGQPGPRSETPLGVDTRVAAEWALGLIHEGKADPSLIQALEARVSDVPSPAGGDHPLVRRMAAISIGRMKAKGAVPTLRQFYEGKVTFDPVNNGCGWAIEQITGEAMPAATVTRSQSGWFLTRTD